MISSYQKLKNRIEEQNEYILRLEKAVYDNDVVYLFDVKARYKVSTDIAKALFFGDSTHPSTKAVGIIEQIKKK